MDYEKFIKVRKNLDIDLDDDKNYKEVREDFKRVLKAVVEMEDILSVVSDDTEKLDFNENTESNEIRRRGE